MPPSTSPAMTVTTGSFAGKVAATGYDENDLETPGMVDVEFTVGEDFIRVHRRSFKIMASPIG